LAEPLIISTSKRDDHQLEMTIQLGPERTDEALHRAARQVSKRAKIPGFRPGKAPYATVLRMFGRDALLGQIMEELGDEVYKEALEVEEIEPYGQADLEDVKTDPVSFKLVLPLQPETHLGDYRNLRIAVPEVVVTDADVDSVLEKAADERAAVQAVERPAALGDTVLVDIHGAVGDETIMDNHDWEVLLEGGEGNWLPGFDDAFVGMVAGDEKTFTLKYPDESASRYRGQEATFQATVKEVRSNVRPQMDDEFARSLGEYADLADLRAKTREELTRQRTADAEEELDGKAVDALVAQATFAYPPSAVTGMVEEMQNQLEVALSPVGYSLEDYLRLQGTSVEAYREQMLPSAERRLKARLALTELANAEGITVTADESQAEAERLAGEAVNEDRARSVRQTLGSEAGQWLISRDLRTRKARERLREIVTGPMPEPGAAVESESPQAEETAVPPSDEAAGAAGEAAEAPRAPEGETKKKRRAKKTTVESIERTEAK
jgi:trigger factor